MKQTEVLADQLKAQPRRNMKVKKKNQKSKDNAGSRGNQSAIKKNKKKEKRSKSVAK